MRNKPLETEEEFIKLLPLVMRFSLQTKTPLNVHLNEITESMRNPLYLTHIGGDDEKLVRYICGYFINQTDFMVSQAFSVDDPEKSMLAYKVFEEELYKKGIRKLVMMTHLNPRVFRKFGFKFERFLLTKELV